MRGEETRVKTENTLSLVNPLFPHSLSGTVTYRGAVTTFYSEGIKNADQREEMRLKKSGSNSFPR